jgi:DNA modification methylase
MHEATDQNCRSLDKYPETCKTTVSANIMDRENIMQQLTLPHISVSGSLASPSLNYRETAKALLTQNLDFHDQQSGYASHNFHAFPAKFPPQLPQTFIEHLTMPGDAVLDPMMGSGTTIVEAYLSGRHAYGLDIDPLALRIAQVKVMPLDVEFIANMSQLIIHRARQAIHVEIDALQNYLQTHYDDKSKAFINYWFAPETQLELVALIREIEQLTDTQVKTFFEVAFSAIIITKTGGVSLAFDLAHTRPHRAKIVFGKDGTCLYNHGNTLDTSRAALLTKTLRSAIDEFAKRAQANMRGILPLESQRIPAVLQAGDAQSMPIASNSVDLIVTSPPYASNAIDYMRAHKFALVWLGYAVDSLTQKRRAYIGGEGALPNYLEPLSGKPAQIVAEIAALDSSKAVSLHRYYSEMTRVIKEMWRVLKPGKAAIIVVGTSIIREHDIEIAACLADIGQQQGFELLGIGIRNIDRNRRMLPASTKRNSSSQIQQRMHEEYVIGLFKPE